MKRDFLTLPDVRLAYLDFGGTGPDVLLLHGLFGRASTWAETARWLTPHFHVVGIDQRGHGWSDKPENAYSRADYVNDAAQVIERLGLGPAIIIGHSMGALNAWVLAAERPDLVRAVVLEDMGADTAARPATATRYQQWLAEWPVPFATLADVRAYFGSSSPGEGEFFAEVMKEGPEGYRPLFEYRHMLQSAANWSTKSYWAELEAVQCPALVVRAELGGYTTAELQEMARRLPKGRYAQVAGAGHVIHYDQPQAWQKLVEPFLLEVAHPA